MVSQATKKTLSDAETMAAIRRFKLELLIRGRGSIAGQRANEESTDRVWYVKDANWDGTAFVHATPNDAVAEYLDNLTSEAPAESSQSPGSIPPRSV
jgi:hypothetical protein